MDHVLALDVGASKTLVRVVRLGALAAEGWRPDARATVRIATDRDPARLVERIAALARGGAGAGAVAGRNAGARIVAIGCAVPGPLDAAAGVVVHSPNLGWHDVPLGPMLAERLGAPVRMDDDATLGALGEARYGAGRGADPFAYLTVSSGIGMGVVVGGRPLRGAHGLAGEVGHLVVDPAGPRCGCGRRGDVEAYAGGSALARRARATWGRDGLADGGPAPRDADALFRAARSGDPVARAIAEDAATALGAAIAAVAAVLDPTRIAVGGAIGLGQAGLVRRATAIARRRCIAETGRSIEVVRARLGAESVLAGAAALALGEHAGASPGPGGRPGRSATASAAGES